MELLSANEAKTNFGSLLIKVQREPVQINRNGKAVAVLVSFNDYESLEALKVQYLEYRIKQAREDIALGNVCDGEEFIDDLLAGKFD